ncbi:lipid kinase [Capsulimonas corticalis]|uniref:Lipid kinase n=1 Tax=Capsulimonas corticalis TaxID=2219043 RepID=A0A402CNY1_9BACT|nr:diacylglycerol kinase family protein [Capsulimonas corticalis]BDI33152.1 lipid kinase [Capsulimonas corticalis]
MPYSTTNVVIVNPTAGRGEAGKQVPAIRRLLDSDSADWVWLYTKARGDAESMAREAAAGGAKIVVAVGGDGTLHEVANGLLGTQTTLGLIPFGTGNDLARSLNLFGNLEVACRAVTHGRILHLDVGVIEGAGFDGPRHFLVIAGTGFDARTAQTVNNGVKWIAGAPAYVIGAVKTLMGFSPFALTLTADGEKRETRAMFVSVANAETTGGGMKIAPGAKVDDGQFDICLVGAVSKLTLLHQLTKVFDGAHVRHPAVTILRASEITLEADPPQPLLIDGEVLGTTPAKITLLRGALPMLVPAESNTVA